MLSINDVQDPIAMSRDGLFPRSASRVNSGALRDIALIVKHAGLRWFLLPRNLQPGSGRSRLLLRLQLRARIDLSVCPRKREPERSRPTMPWDILDHWLCSP